jgi:rhamnogalacturonan endolyase
MKSGKIRLLITLSFTLGLLISGLWIHTSNVSASSADSNDVSLQVSGMNATISNGIYTIKFNSLGTGYSLVWHGQEFIGSPAKGFYSSINGGTGFTPTQLEVVTNTPDMADIAYISTWGELHYVVREHISGLYSYFVATGIGTVGEYRTLYRVDSSIFTTGYNGVSTITFPTLSQIQQSTTLQDSTYKLADGTVYTKYDASTYVNQDNLHGAYGNGYGIWMISPSHEYVNGGPMKQELTVHVDATTGDTVVLNMLSASHFGTPSVTIPSGKIYGPWFVYFNNGSIPDAQAQANEQREAWPYKWLSNPHYPLERTDVRGTLHLPNNQRAAGATVVLAQPGGDIYAQGADYIFSTQADCEGHFNIPKVRPGSYSLYAFASGDGTTAAGDKDNCARYNSSAIGSVTDQYELDNVTVGTDNVNLGDLIWTPTEYAHSLWQIGTADRKSDEFKLGNVPRQYGLWNQVPANLIYTIGQSTPANDWYYAQTQVGTWSINFNLNQAYTGNAHLTVAIAGEARTPTISVGVNGTSVETLPTFANDASIYRSANQSGYYHLVIVNFPTSLLKVGANSITFNATNVVGGAGIMYDTIKLETD